MVITKVNKVYIKKITISSNLYDLKTFRMVGI